MTIDRSQRLVIVLCATAGLVLAAALTDVLLAALRGTSTTGSGRTEALPRSFTPAMPVRLSDFRAFSGPDFKTRPGPTTAGDVETKLWSAHGSWWGLLEDSVSGRTGIHRWTGRHWSDTGVTIDERPLSLADVEWTGHRLYVASGFDQGPLLLRTFVMSGDGEWLTHDFGVPVSISTTGATTLSIAVDSLDRVWAAYIYRHRVWVTHSTSHATRFAPPRPLTADGGVQPDDTAAVVAAHGQVAVLWSDQARGAFRFAIREDTDALGRLRVTAPPLTGVHIRDGEIHLLATRDGRILAAVNASQGDLSVDPPTAPLLLLLERSPAGAWKRHTAATTEDQLAEPEIVLSRDERTVFLATTSLQAGGAVYVKVADARSLIFGPGKGTRIIDAAGPVVSAPTVGRARVSAGTGLLVLAADVQNARYYTTFLPLTSR